MNNIIYKNLRNNLNNLKYFSNNVSDIESAYNLYKGLYLQILTQVLEIKDFNTFIELEEFGYKKLIKSFEEDYHYERCLNIFDNTLTLNFNKGFFKRRLTLKKKNKIAFFIHNTASTMAHIDLFYNFIQSIDKEILNNYKIDIFTFSNGGYSQKIKTLINEKKISVFSFKIKDNIYDTFEDLINFYIEGCYRNIIFLSLPIYISYLSKCLPNQVSWWSMKYQIDIFPDLKQRYIGGLFNKSPIDSKYSWIKHGYFIPKENNLKLDMNSFNKNNIKFFTINREEKIRNPQYLDCVKNILNLIPNSEFYWTGRQEDPYIKNFFKNHKLGSRVFYLGWFNIDERGIKHGDIFLDTPNLSGIIAANNFSIGVPVVFFNDSNFYLNFHKNDLENSIQETAIFAEIIKDWYSNIKNSEDRYINITFKLATNEYYRKNYILLSKYLAEKYIHSPKLAKLDLLFQKMVS
jgi:hypothetical protein